MTAQRGQRRVTVAVALAAVMTFAMPATAGTTEDAHQLLYEINLARWNPVEFERSSEADIPRLVAGPPLAVSSNLSDSTKAKANEMAAHGYFAHQSPVTGMWPNELARLHGFDLPHYWPDDKNYIEALQSGSTLPIMVLTSFANSESHRRLIFGEGGFSDYNEIGVGRSSSENYWAVHMARQDGPAIYITGFAYDDQNGNGRMDRGEGLAGVEVSVGGASRTTNSGGAYSIRVSSGDYDVSATKDGQPLTTKSAHVTVRSLNVGVDFVQGQKKPIARQYTLCYGLQPTILGTSGNDILYGTNGPDVIHGLGGKDRIFGLGGDDIICGGGGKDKLVGGDGDDVLLGGGKDDKLIGQAGNDTLDGGGGQDFFKGGGGNDVLEDASSEDRIYVKT
jgi:hypothetical protein